MKKALWIIGIIFTVATPAHAAFEEHATHSPLARSGIVFTRGVLNIVGLPLEVFRTAGAEGKIHKRAWPVTVVPRVVTNIFLRAASGVNDVFLFPPVVLFTDDISPWTEPMGLPEYPWQSD